VIQLVVEIMPVVRAAFVAKELSGVAAKVARHRYGCRVIIRLLEHSAAEESTISLVNELLEQSHELVRHSFGRFVLQAVLEHGLAGQQHCIAAALHDQRHYIAVHGRNSQDPECGLLFNAKGRNASCVFETAMVHCSHEDKDDLCRLLASPEHVLELAREPFGCYVLKALLSCPSEHTQGALTTIQEASQELQGSKHGKKVLGHLGLLDHVGFDEDSTR